MDSKDAVFLIEKLRQNTIVELNLSDTQEFVLHRCLLGLSYQEIADLSGYDHDYIKQTGAKLWRSLSTVLNKKVTKSNIRNILNQYCQEQEKINLHSLSRESQTNQPESRSDWGDAVDVSSFVGRKQELDLAQTLILQNRDRLITVLGMGGVGKTAFTSKLVRDIAGEFQYVIWRSLRNATPFQELLEDLISFLTRDRELTLLDASDSRLDRLMHYLATSRCLIVLDNLESILRRGQTGGQYCQDYEGYGQLLRRVADQRHQSCLIVTSREQPIGISFRKGEDSPVSILQLGGLNLPEGYQILADKKIFIETDTVSNLVQIYSGNPLALKIVSTSIDTLFNGSIAEFLSQGSMIFGDIWDLLEQQFSRLTELEQEIMYWLAIARVPQSMLQLSQNLVNKVPSRVFLRVIELLRGRSLIEITPQGCTQQSMVMEYVTEKLIGKIHQEVISQKLDLLLNLPLIQAQSSDLIRQAPTCLILKSVLESLLIATKKKSNLEQLLYSLIDKLRGQSFLEVGYGVGNILNLLGELDSDLQGKDFSNLSIWQAYLPETVFAQANFAHSNFRQSQFTETSDSVNSLSFGSDD